MKTYDITVTRDGEWWMVGIPEIDGLTQARSLEEVVPIAQDYIAVTLDIPITSFIVTITHLEE
ncbi:hypothetical protein [Microbacterium sp. SSM24]|uniref:hypothetical protein n=1 Tax=Microbacterium sp. SSM24 TaxID=2991714 RepID=UPI002226AB9E|nr:hypothetical protein [Microbacterium sp. SSM24]MCW3494553.1 hypothetical protein [Microbacterium sp. SSM24]